MECVERVWLMLIQHVFKFMMSVLAALSMSAACKEDSVWIPIVM